MSIQLTASVFALAVTSYGEVRDGQPSWAQREMHTYTNMVRVDPGSLSDEYPCNYNQFQPSEKTPKEPLFYSQGLSAIAQMHSEDMEANRFMDHDSSDGTPFDERVWPYYDGRTIAENVAMGYRDNYAAVVDGWMCSSGHRANIMSGDLEDFGGGVASTYYTQDFGGGAGTAFIPVAMGVHTPAQPNSNVSYLATWSHDESPNGLWVETNTGCEAMSRTSGTGSLGAWELNTDADTGCIAYRFVWETADGSEGALPTSGAYQFGNGCTPWVSEATDGCSMDSGSGSGSSGGDDSGNQDEQGTQGDEDGDNGDLGDTSEDTESSSGNNSGAGNDCPEDDRNGDCLSDPALASDHQVSGCATANTSPSWALALLALGLVHRRRT